MKTYKQFQEAVALAAPAIGLGARAALPILGGGIKLVGDLMKADTAQPRTPNVQRPSGKITAAEKQKRQAREDRRAEAARRARERGATGQGELGKKAEEIIQKERQLAKDAEYAKQRRENPALRDAEAKQRVINNRRAAMRERMRKAAEQQGLD